MAGAMGRFALHGTMTMEPFHLAFPVHDLEAARTFYVEVLGCRVGREDRHWIDFDFHGHQISAHLVGATGAPSAVNPVDGDAVPVPHFGLVLEWRAWHALADRLREAGVTFRIAPRIRFSGLPGEQATFFLTDPSGNAVEFKSFREPARLFAR